MSARDLATRSCKDCTPGAERLEDAQAAELHLQIDAAWERAADQVIRRVFTFSNFREPFALATQIALLAESQGHHPDLEVSWGKLTVTFTTHHAGGLTESDFVMAAKIDAFAPT
ncbi:MAG: 4a-hydroxytetrahydrobiopterin dehydratase [Pseudonocardiales bacterium]|nr:4a-hydroxytetrahydrobiopterin dehydratase [Actinomycetota bacterium]PZS21606.1 MAG: 4a-hydroxytetrahydrobiopterin dehydratase [Pseudonocardiales bacterium]